MGDLADLLGHAARAKAAVSRQGPAAPEPTTKTGKAVALAKAHTPGAVATTLATLREADSFLDKIPVIGYETPLAPSKQQRVASGLMGVLYTGAAGCSIIPFVGPWAASALIAVGGGVAKAKSSDPLIQNEANLALQTSVYAAAGGFVPVVPVSTGIYGRAAIKSFATMLRRTPQE